jgi:hypothetical protein
MLGEELGTRARFFLRPGPLQRLAGDRMCATMWTSTSQIAWSWHGGQEGMTYGHG